MRAPRRLEVDLAFVNVGRRAAHPDRLAWRPVNGQRSAGHVHIDRRCQSLGTDCCDRGCAGAGAAGERQSGAALPGAQLEPASVTSATLTLIRSGKAGSVSIRGPRTSSGTASASVDEEDEVRIADIDRHRAVRARPTPSAAGWCPSDRPAGCRPRRNVARPARPRPRRRRPSLRRSPPAVSIVRGAGQRDDAARGIAAALDLAAVGIPDPHREVGVALGSSTISWSQPMPVRRSQMARASAGVTSSASFRASRITKSLPRPCILWKGRRMGRDLGSGRARVHQLRKPESCNAPPLTSCNRYSSPRCLMRSRPQGRVGRGAQQHVARYPGDPSEYTFADLPKAVQDSIVASDPRRFHPIAEGGLCRRAEGREPSRSDLDRVPERDRRAAGTESGSPVRPQSRPGRRGPGGGGVVRGGRPPKGGGDGGGEWRKP